MSNTKFIKLKTYESEDSFIEVKTVYINVDCIMSFAESDNGVYVSIKGGNSYTYDITIKND